MAEHDGLTEDQVPRAVWRDIQPFHIPNLETFRWIHQNIKLATHVSSFPQQLVIELQKMTDQHFEEVLETLPDTIGCMNVGYVNGQLLSKKHGRQKTPQPRELDGDYDDTDYLAPQNGGVLKPGMLLECEGFLEIMMSDKELCSPIRESK